MHSHVMFHLIFVANILVYQHILSLANALLRQVKAINVSIMLFWFERLTTISIPLIMLWNTREENDISQMG